MKIENGIQRTTYHVIQVQIPLIGKMVIIMHLYHHQQNNLINRRVEHKPADQKNAGDKIIQNLILQRREYVGQRKRMGISESGGETIVQSIRHMSQLNC